MQTLAEVGNAEGIGNAEGVGSATRTASVIAAIRQELSDPLELSLLTSLLLILLYGDEHWYAHILLSAIAVAGLAFRSLRRSPQIWAVAAAVSLASVGVNYWTVDNHKYLIGYWTLALAIALHTSQPRAMLERASSLLIGACMGLAVLWKLFTTDYTNGGFFEYEMLLDNRFANLAKLVGGLSAEQLKQNTAAVARLTSWLPSGNEASLVSSDSVHRLAIGLTWWTVVIESTIAIVFLSPKTWRIAALRDPLLVAFVSTTYFIAPVYGFAYVLIAMGLAQCRTDSRWLAGYMGAFVMIQLYDAPWSIAAHWLPGQ